MSEPRDVEERIAELRQRIAPMRAAMDRGEDVVLGGYCWRNSDVKRCEAALSQLDEARQRIRELEADGKRLDAMERYATERSSGRGDTDDFAQVMLSVDEEVTEFTVTGPLTHWGNRLGEGPTLRAAIDNAMAWENANNRHDFGSTVPASVPPTDPSV